MTLEKDTIITLENNERYIINNITFYGGIKYALATNEKDEKDIKILEEIIEDNQLYIQVVSDDELLSILKKILQP